MKRWKALALIPVCAFIVGCSFGSGHGTPQSTTGPAGSPAVLAEPDLNPHIVLPDGPARGSGFRGGAPDLTRLDLEHYRGRIVRGGEQTVLRLTNPDGTREGRDISVAVPESVLSTKLRLWQIEYGIGRTLDVWGLSNGSESMVAYRIEMADPPPETVLDANLIDGLPIYPGSYIRPSESPWVELVVKDVAPAIVTQWYLEQMPEYGWIENGVGSGPGPGIRVNFRSAARTMSGVDVDPMENGALITLRNLGGMVP